MLATALGMAALRSGNACLQAGDERGAGKHYGVSAVEFARASTAVDAWGDVEAIVKAPPVLRRCAPQAMVQYAMAWVQVAWALKNASSRGPECVTAQLYAGAHVCAERSLSLLAGVAAGDWRAYIEHFGSDLKLLTVRTVVDQLSKTDYGSAVALLRDTLTVYTFPTTVRASLNQTLRDMTASNNTIHFSPVPDKLSTAQIKNLMPAPVYVHA
jgi:hypothetical protein